ncbi:MAG: ATP-binding protein [Bacteroidota bacterium]
MDHLRDVILEQILISDKNNCVQNLEDNKIEYKGILDWNNKASKIKYLKELAALGNSGGGYLIFGINDKTGHIDGISENEKIETEIISNAFSSYFSPELNFSARYFTKNETKLFIIYAHPFDDIPAICIKDHDYLKNGNLYWRYSGKSEPIKGNEFINLLHNLGSSIKATRELIALETKKRKVDLLPEFQRFYGISTPEYTSINFKNIGERATIIDVLELDENMVHINPLCKSKSYIEKDKEWVFFGNYKKFRLPNLQRKSHFKLIFSNKDGIVYYQDFKGDNGAIHEQCEPKEYSLIN